MNFHLKNPNSNLLFPVGQARFFAPERDKEIGQKGSTGQGAGGQPVDNSIVDLKETLNILNKLPEGEREAALKELTTKVKNLESIGSKRAEEYAHKLEDLQARGEDLKLVDIIRGNKELAAILEDTIKKYQSGNLKKDNLDKKLSVIDRWIDNASDKESREELRELKEYIEGTKESQTLKEEVKLLKDELSILKVTTHSSSMDRVAGGIDNLANKYGEEHIGKYKEAMLKKAVSFKQLPNENFDTYMDKLFVEVASPSDYKAAFSNETKLAEEHRLKQRKDGLEPDMVSITSGLTVKKDKVGRVDTKSLIHDLLAKIKSPLLGHR